MSIKVGRQGISIATMGEYVGGEPEGTQIPGGEVAAATHVQRGREGREGENTR